MTPYTCTYRVCMVRIYIYVHVYSKLFVQRNSIPSNKMSATVDTDYRAGGES